MRGKKFEEIAAKTMGGKILGGPDEPDYRRGRIAGEVKNWKDMMGKFDVMKEAKKGRDEIVSRMGFTDEAIDYRNQYRSNLRLFDWKNKKLV